MEVVDSFFRAGAASVALLLAAFLWRDARQAPAAGYFSLLAVCLCGFLFRNTPHMPALPASIDMIAKFLSGNQAILIWWFCLALFDDDFRRGRLEWGVAGLWFALFLVDRSLIAPPSAAQDFNFSWALVTVGLFIVGHIAWRLLSDFNSDLVEQRRSRRHLFAAVAAGLLLVDLVVDIILGFAWKPQWFTLLQNGAIFIFIGSLAAWLLRTDMQTLAFEQALPAAAVNRPAALTSEEAMLRKRLDVLIERERIFLQADITFGGFAERMEAPEQKVRALINKTLGYRNFRSFLNAYRLAAARRALADPDRSHEKILSIALDCGFASLASFNRAFKIAEHMSPSEFRRNALSAPADDVDNVKTAASPLSNSPKLLFEK